MTAPDPKDPSTWPPLSQLAGNAPQNPNTGIVCPKCGCGHLPSGSTRREGDTMVRYRYCRNKNCGHAIRTVETVEGIVTKRKSSENSTDAVQDSLKVFREAS